MRAEEILKWIGGADEVIVAEAQAAAEARLRASKLRRKMKLRVIIPAAAAVLFVLIGAGAVVRSGLGGKASERSDNHKIAMESFKEEAAGAAQGEEKEAATQARIQNNADGEVYMYSETGAGEMFDLKAAGEEEALSILPDFASAVFRRSGTERALVLELHIDGSKLPEEWMTSSARIELSGGEKCRHIDILSVALQDYEGNPAGSEKPEIRTSDGDMLSCSLNLSDEYMTVYTIRFESEENSVTEPEDVSGRLVFAGEDGFEDDYFLSFTGYEAENIEP